MRKLAFEKPLKSQPKSQRITLAINKAYIQAIYCFAVHFLFFRYWGIKDTYQILPFSLHFIQIGFLHAYCLSPYHSVNKYILHV